LSAKITNGTLQRSNATCHGAQIRFCLVSSTEGIGKLTLAIRECRTRSLGLGFGTLLRTERVLACSLRRGFPCRRFLRTRSCFPYLN